jgi:hypothetical protein
MQQTIACDSKIPNLGHLGLFNQRVNSKISPYGRMGQDLSRRKLQTDRMLQFARGVRFRLGFNPSHCSHVPQPPGLHDACVSPGLRVSCSGSVMSNRGGGNPNRGRPPVGRGGFGWHDGSE